MRPEVPTILIQDLGSFLGELRPQLDDLLSARLGRFCWWYIPTGVGGWQHPFIVWMVRKLIDEIYYLNDPEYNKNDMFFQRLYQELREHVRIDIGACFAHYIKAPQIYPDNHTVHVSCTQLAVYIRYTLPRKKFSINNGYRQIPN